MEIKQYQIDCLKLSSHEYLKEVFNFPDYYGKNLSALYDCLTDKPSFDLIINNYERIDEEGQKILRVITKAVADNGGNISFNYQ